MPTDLDVGPGDGQDGAGAPGGGADGAQGAAVVHMHGHHGVAGQEGGQVGLPVCVCVGGDNRDRIPSTGG